MVKQFSIEIFEKPCPECGKVIQPTEKLMEHIVSIHLTTIGGPWYFWLGRCVSKAHKPVTLSGNPTFTKV